MRIQLVAVVVSTCVRTFGIESLRWCKHVICLAALHHWQLGGLYQNHSTLELLHLAI